MDPFTLFRSAPHRQRVGPTIAAVLTLGCLISAGGAGTGGLLSTQVRVKATLAALRICEGAPQSATVMPDPPWPQERYDLNALSQITDGSGVTVAVIDSGVDTHHPQLTGVVRPGSDALDRGGDGRMDCVGHGTAVASIIAARAMAGSGLRGLAPGARILPVRASERIQTNGTVTGAGTVDDLAAGIRAAVASRPRPAVINLSLSASRDSPALRAAVRAALSADIVVVAAVGNNHAGGDPPSYPAAYDGVVGVGAIGPTGARVESSQVGSYVDLVAPGEAVTAAAPTRGHLVVSGTSFAAPFVSATAALIRAREPRLTQSQVVRRLISTADPAPGAPPDSPGYGAGVLNPLRAVTDVGTNAVPETPLPHSSATADTDPRAGVGFVASPESDGTAITSHPARTAVVGVAFALIAAAVAIGIGAVAIPRGRRRGWRVGR